MSQLDIAFIIIIFLFKSFFDKSISLTVGFIRDQFFVAAGNWLVPGGCEMNLCHTFCLNWGIFSFLMFLIKRNCLVPVQTDSFYVRTGIYLGFVEIVHGFFEFLTASVGHFGRVGLESGKMRISLICFAIFCASGNEVVILALFVFV